LVNSFFTLVLGLGLITFSLTSNKLSTSLRPWVPPLVWLGLASAFFLLAREPAIMLNHPFDEDESMFLTTLQRMTVAPVMWKDIDGYSSGPLNYYPLYFLMSIGVPMNYSVLHLYASLLLLAAVGVFVWSQWSTLSQLLGASILIVLGTTHSNTLLSYASELPSLLLISISMAMLLRDKKSSGVLIGFALGLIIGLIPFAKLQGVPIGITLGICALWAYRRSGWPALGLLVLGGLLPTAVVFGAAYVGGYIDDLWQRYILTSFHYTSSVPGLEKLAILPIFNVGEPLALTLWVLVSLGSALSFTALAPRTLLVGSVVMCLVVVLSAIVAVYAPGNDFIHYAFYLVIPWLFFLSVLFRSLPCHLTSGAIYACGGLALICLVWPFPKTGSLEGLPISLRPAQQLAEVAKIPPGSVIGVWGWAFDYYVDLKAISFSRETTIGALTEGWPGMEKLREKYKNDMLTNPPEYFVEAVGAGQFFKDKKKYGVETWPWLADHLGENYEVIATTPNKEVCVWKRKK